MLRILFFLFHMHEKMTYSFTYIISVTKAIWFFFVRKYHVGALLGPVLIGQRSSRSRKRWTLLIFRNRDLRPACDACARKWRHLATCYSATYDHCRPDLNPPKSHFSFCTTHVNIGNTIGINNISCVKHSRVRGIHVAMPRHESIGINSTQLTSRTLISTK